MDSGGQKNRRARIIRNLKDYISSFANICQAFRGDKNAYSSGGEKRIRAWSRIKSSRISLSSPPSCSEVRRYHICFSKFNFLCKAYRGGNSVEHLLHFLLVHPAVRAVCHKSLHYTIYMTLNTSEKPN